MCMGLGSVFLIIVCLSRENNYIKLGLCQVFTLTKVSIYTLEVSFREVLMEYQTM